jgi:glycerol kinase
MVLNDLLMQFQADILNVPVIRPKVFETTALGAAYAAGLAVGYWKNLDMLVQNWEQDKIWEPQMNASDRQTTYKHWTKAVEKSYGWIE